MIWANPDTGITLYTNLLIPYYFAAGKFKCIDRTLPDTGLTVAAKPLSLRIMAILTFNITPLKKYGSAVAGTVYKCLI